MATFDVNFFSKSLRRLTRMTAIVPIEETQLIPGVPVPYKSKPFRTLVLLHGFSSNEKEWLHGSRIELLAALHNVAVLFPYGENSFYVDDTARDALYEQYVCREILDFGRKVFPLSSKREDTTIGGLSMGGYGALRNGLKNSEVFGNIIAFSSALVTDKLAELEAHQDNPLATAAYYNHVFGKPTEIKGSDRDPKTLAKAVVEKGGQRPNIYMACGAEDFLIESNRSFSAYLNDIGLDHEFHVSPGVHNWVFWDEYIEKALLWLDSENGAV